MVAKQMIIDEQEIKYLMISGEKYEKLFEKAFLCGVVIIPFILTFILVITLMIRKDF